MHSPKVIDQKNNYNPQKADNHPVDKYRAGVHFNPNWLSNLIETRSRIRYHTGNAIVCQGNVHLYETNARFR